MKLTTLFLLTALLHVSASGVSQVISLAEKNAPLEKLFKEIRRQSGYEFVYNTRAVQASPKLDINLASATLDEALKAVLKTTSFTYTIQDKTIIISPKPVVPNEKPVQVEAPVGIDVTVTVVAAENNQTLEGASVTVKGNSKGVATDVNGRAVLKDVDANATLVVSYTGYANQEIKLGGRNAVVVKLNAITSELDEVIINKGYYTEKQKYSVSNVGRVTSKELEKQPVNNPLLALQGRIPGLFITQANGLPGSGITVRIQGQNSIQSGNDPLYVIDGVPYINQLLPGLGSVLGSSGSGVQGNPLSFINASDIESIDVLKDADATAIYGSRAANGAILITTKKGKAGKTTVDFNLQTGWGKITRKLDLLNTQQYLEMRKEAYTNDGLPTPNNSSTPDPSNYDLTVWDQNRYTDWQKVLIGGTSRFNQYQLNISGGSQALQYIVGAGYREETTVFPGDFADRNTSLHFGIINNSANQKFKLSLNGTYFVDNNELPNQDLSEQAIKLAPNAPALYLQDGSINWARIVAGPDSISTWYNPLARFNNRYSRKTNNLVGNSVLSYQLTSNLEIKTNFGYTLLQTDEMNTNPLSSAVPELRSTTLRTASYANSQINSWIVEPQASYKKDIGQGKLEVLVGTTFNQVNSKSNRIDASGFNSDLVLEDIKAATLVTIPTGGSIISTYKYNAVFGRSNFIWGNKYIINLTARRDGSSRFGSKSQFNNFYSIAGGWVFSNEKFVQTALPFLSHGKLRGSFGTTGNDQIGDYRFLNLYTNNGDLVTVPYQGMNGLGPNGLPNPYLQWEETKKLQIGLELGFLNDRILFNTNFINNRSSNQLLPYLLPIQTGVDNVTRNFPATVQNSSWEFVINSKIINQKNFTWSASFNLTLPQNELIDFPSLATSAYSSSLVIGKPISLIKLYQSTGVDPVTGRYLFADAAGAATLSPDFFKDRNGFISSAPTFYGGFSNAISYKGFELDFLFQFVKQTGRNYFVGDKPGLFSSAASMMANQPLSVLDRWKKAGDNASIQIFSSLYPSAISSSFTYINESDLVYRDASYIRLKNVSLSWQLPEKWRNKIKIQDCRLFLHGQNLLTITDYAGGDPENRSPILAPLRLITMGAQIKL